MTSRPRARSQHHEPSVSCETLLRPIGSPRPRRRPRDYQGRDDEHAPRPIALAQVDTKTSQRPRDRPDRGGAPRDRAGFPDHPALLAMEAAGLRGAARDDPGGARPFPGAAINRRRRYLPLLPASLLGAGIRGLRPEPRRLDQEAYRQTHRHRRQRRAVRRRHRARCKANLPRAPGSTTCSTGWSATSSIWSRSVARCWSTRPGRARCRRPATTNCCPSSPRRSRHCPDSPGP